MSPTHNNTQSKVSSYFILSQVAKLIYCSRRPAVQPVQFVCARCIEPLLTVRTALASRVSVPDTIGGRVVVVHSPVLWVQCS